SRDWSSDVCSSDLPGSALGDLWFALAPPSELHIPGVGRSRIAASQTTRCLRAHDSVRARAGRFLSHGGSLRLGHDATGEATTGNLFVRASRVLLDGFRLSLRRQPAGEAPAGCACRRFDHARPCGDSERNVAHPASQCSRGDALDGERAGIRAYRDTATESAALQRATDFPYGRGGLRVTLD